MSGAPHFAKPALPPASHPGWIKICGMTRLEDALLAAECGAHAAGFIFAPSPRRIEPEAAAAIIARLPPEVLPVGVFVNASAAEMLAAAQRSGVRALQLHGHEPAAGMEALSAYVLIKTLLIPPDIQMEVQPPGGDLNPMLFTNEPRQAAGNGTGEFPARDYWQWRERADAWLFEQKTGPREAADNWRFPGDARWIYAGRLLPETVPRAIAALHPWGVDAASGIEARPGVKDPAKLREFITNARAAFQAWTAAPRKATS